MSPEKQAALFDKYPDIFCERNLPMTETCLYWGICCGEGWYKLLDKLCAQFALIKRYSGLEVIATQVKSKFASLRFYYHLTYPVASTEEEKTHWMHIVNALIGEAERVSGQTCEETGQYGTMCVRGGWYKTLCEEKAKELGFMTMEEWKRLREEEEKAKG